MDEIDSSDGSDSAVLDALKGVAEGLVRTLGGHVEVVLHDYRTPDASVVAVAGDVTGRHVGGAMSQIGLSVLAEGNDAKDRLNYLVRTPDGRSLKSSTMVLRNANGEVFGAFCVNVDTTPLRIAAAALEDMVGPTPTEESLLFADDIGSVIESVIDKAERAAGRSFNQLSRSGRLDMVKALDQSGVFKLQRSAAQVAEHLNVSRATLYGYLAEVRRENEGD